MPNLVGSPRFWRKKVVVLKGETTYGSDATPTGAANWMEARNVSFTSFEAETADRNIELPAMGNGGKVITSIWSKLSFDIALAGSGAAGTAPKWEPAVLACALASTVSVGTSVTYNLVSASFKSATSYIEVDGVLYKLIGCRGNLKGRLNAKGIPFFTVELSSLYTTPVAGTISGIDKTGWTFEDAVNSVNTGKVTINGTDLAFSAFEWDLGNQLSRINLPGPQLEVAIGSKSPSASVTVVAPALATFNPYAIAEAGTVVPVSNTHGTVAGKKIKTDLLARILNIAEDQIEGMAAYKLTLEPFQNAGNDEFVLTNL